MNFLQEKKTSIPEKRIKIRTFYYFLSRVDICAFFDGREIIIIQFSRQLLFLTQREIMVIIITTIIIATTIITIES
jgi:hypothetical protein